MKNALLPLLCGLVLSISPKTLAVYAADDAPQLRSAGDLLDLYGVGADRLASFTDGQPVDDGERETLMRVLYAARRFSLGEWYRWRESKLPWSKWSEAPLATRGEIFALRGAVRRVTIEEPPAELAERFDLSRYYRCELVLDDDAQPAIVYALAVPKDWKLDAPMNEPGGATGIFLKFAGAKPEPITPVFVAHRAAWYPNTELGHLGMDVGLFDDIKDRTRMQSEDGECFYELLAAVGRANQRELLQRTREEIPGKPRYSLEPLFNDPQSQHGQLLALTGTVRRAVEIRIENPEIVAALGFNHYYELEFLTANSQGNPLTFCARELPHGMPRGEGLSRDVRVAGFFFKVWSYPIHPHPGEVKYQMAPLIVGREPAMYNDPAPDSRFSTIVAIVLGISLVLLALVLWWMHHNDERARRKMHTTRAQPTGLDELPKVD